MEAKTEERWGGDLLREWLEAHNVRGDKRGEIFGVTKGRISQIINDQNDGPGLELSKLIEERTGGAVPVLSWGKKFAVMVDAPDESEKGAAA